jgi:hypothetical protein
MLTHAVSMVQELSRCRILVQSVDRGGGGGGAVCLIGCDAMLM